jgi:hypothetical protein
MSRITFRRKRVKLKQLLGIRARLVLLALILVAPLTVRAKLFRGSRRFYNRRPTSTLRPKAPATGPAASVAWARPNDTQPQT